MVRTDQPGAPTTGNRYRAAGFLRRSLASVIDLVVLAPWWLLFLFLLHLWFSRTLSGAKLSTLEGWLGFWAAGSPTGRAWVIMSGVVWVLYRFCFQAVWGCTVGQRLLNMRVVDEYGEKPGLARTWLRTLASLSSLVLLGAGYLWAAFDPERRALHDWVAGTYVIRPQTPRKERK